MTETIKAVRSTVHAKARQAVTTVKGWPNFLLAMIGVVLLTLILTITSVSIYVSSGVSSIDLSRPGYEQVRGQLINADSEGTFSSEGPVNPNTLDEFNAMYDDRIKELKGLGVYSEKAIDDINLGIAPGQPSGPPAGP